MAEAKVRLNFNLNISDNQKLLLLQESISKENNKKITITDIIKEALDEMYKKRFGN